jgi:hypothetical protein
MHRGPGAYRQETTMHVLLIIAAVLGIVVGAGTTLCAMIFIVAGMPNTSPEQQVKMWRLFWGIAAAGFLCAAGGIMLIITGRPGFAAVVGALPMLLCAGLLIIALMMAS